MMGFKSRREWNLRREWELPPGLDLLPHEAQAVIKALDRYYPEAVRSMFHRPSWAGGNCGTASNEFIHILDQEGVMGVLETFDFKLKGDQEDYPVPLTDRHWGFWHAAVRVEQLVIDWTARQFDGCAPFPGLWTIAPVPRRNRPLKWQRRTPNSDPLCVYWSRDEDAAGDGWCLIKGGISPECWSATTACGKYITLPGRFENQKPTCDACIAILMKGMVPEPEDLPMPLAVD